jgi:hypothetical protein
MNYDETYAQMMRPEAWKMHLVVALHKGWDIRQWDVVAAYLQAELDLRHKIYVADINEKMKLNIRYSTSLCMVSSRQDTNGTKNCNEYSKKEVV